jgi:hypothetical protein
MLLAEEEPPPEPGAVEGLAFFGVTPEKAEQQARAYLGASQAAN